MSVFLVWSFVNFGASVHQYDCLSWFMYEGQGVCRFCWIYFAIFKELSNQIEEKFSVQNWLTAAASLSFTFYVLETVCLNTVFCDVSSWPNMGPLNFTISMNEQEKPTPLFFFFFWPHYRWAWLRQSWPIFERLVIIQMRWRGPLAGGWEGGVARRAWDAAKHDAKEPGAFLQISQTYGKNKKK